MTKFQLLLKTAKEGNINYENKSKEEALSCLISAASRNEVFIFEFSDKNIDHPIEPSQEVINIDAPFEVFSVEYEDQEDCYFLTVPRKEDIYPVYTLCVMVEELKDGGNRYYVLVRGGNDNHQIIITDDGSYWSGIIKTALDKLNTRPCGIQDINEFISFRKNKSKIHIKRDKVFIVTTKKTRYSKRYNKTRSINWDHSWSVRGHWRRVFCPSCVGNGCTKCNSKGLKLDFIGKDRAGNRTVIGKTWVSHSIKNPDKDPLKKVRKVVENP